LILRELIHSERWVELLHDGRVAVTSGAESGDLAGRDFASKPLAGVVGKFLVLLGRVTAVAEGASEAGPSVDIVGERSRGWRHARVVQGEVALHTAAEGGGL
jgi:hypothetical protein